MNTVHLSLALLLLFSMDGAAAAWQTAPAHDDNPALPFGVAFTVNERGHRAEVFKDREGRVYLRFVREQKLPSFSPTSCPTFQIDQRKPMYHYEIGESCTVEDKGITVLLGEIRDSRITSLALHRLMNGGQLAFRYTTRDGTYHESLFKLRNSKQALENVLGSGTQVSTE